MRVPDEVERMVGARQRSLEIAQDGVYGVEPRQLDAGFPAVDDFAIVDRTGFRIGREAGLAIGDHRQGQNQEAVNEVGQGYLGEGQRREAGERRLAALCGLRCSDKGHLVLGASSGLSTRALASEIRVVDLDQLGELAPLPPKPHDLHGLVLDEKGGLVANPQVGHELQGRQLVLRLDKQVHDQEAGRQRQLGGLEHRPALERALVPMDAAVPVAPTSLLRYVDSREQLRSVLPLFLGILLSLFSLHCRAGDLRPYLGLQGGVVSGSLDISYGNSNATFTSDHPHAWGGGFAGIEYRFGTSFALAAEADFSAGSIKIAEGRLGAASADAKIQRIWTISFLPSVYLDDHWRLFLRAGAGRLNGVGKASDGLGTTVSADGGFSAVKVGLGIQRDFDSGVFVRAEYFYLATKREDFVKPAASGLQISVGYAF